ncbi:DUF2510 domain-containing protein [Rhodococcus zopfii]|uniref:DUF2510 domain-containing protein n=1 Tax=Rhodococcus zopfii TaxID=43772 RepID=A0ABU3WUD0_9NOCA|nr:MULTISPECIES: DUF2510 domain-containing protein [Rhodococcus]MDV2477616.1 DUF2510 domain-containing protein [Rhodococcus zopfii]RGP46343.1 hypothetical protein AWH04_04200 [Rhodococcus erythropolis]
MTTTERALGWHRDPGNDGLQRWWDGTAWTALVRPIPRPRVTDVETAPPSEPAPPRTPMSTDAKRALIITAVAAVLFAVWGYTTVVGANPPSPPSVAEQDTTP